MNPSAYNMNQNKSIFGEVGGTSMAAAITRLVLRASLLGHRIKYLTF